MSLVSYFKPEKRRTLLYGFSAFVVVSLIVLGIMGQNGWLPSTDPMTGQKTGWFGKRVSSPHVSKGSASNETSWFSSAPPSPTPQLAREYIYAGSGSRLLAVVDANANAAPPADLAVWRPSNGTWYVLGGVPGSNMAIQGWGADGDDPVPGDYDGDGKTDFSIFRPGTGTCPCAVTWYIIHSSTGAQVSFLYAMNGDLPAQADYDGDGKTDPAIYRPPTGGATYGVWHIQGTSLGYYTYTWGEAGDLPASADYDGDGRADVAVFRPTNRKFYSIQSSNQYLVTIDTSFNPSNPTWKTVSADYDGDGRADYAVYDQAAANWYIRSSVSSSFPANPVQWGAPGDTAVPNDYDGDGKCDIATWRNSNGHWYIRQSSLLGQSNELRTATWGAPGDIPVPAFYRR